MNNTMILSATLLALALVASGEAPYAFRERLEHIHRSDVRDMDLRCADDEFELKSGVAVVIPKPAGEVLYRAARDFEDYLSVSMRVSAGGVWRERRSNAVSVAFGGERGYTVDVGEDGVQIVAADERQAAQALYHLEDRMNLREGPFLRRGTETRKPVFDVRMTHSGYGNDIFPDAHLAQMAHYGMTAIIVFLADIDKTKAQPYQDLKALIRRAAKFGLDTYLYSYIKAWAHPDDGDGAFEESYGRIAGYYPEAKGIILVGESCQFPSKDPRVQPRTHKNRNLKDRRPLAGWYPCVDYPKWLAAVRRAITARAPKMEVVFWTYNWGGAPAKERLRLIDDLAANPVLKDVSLMATFEMFERRTLRNGYKTQIDDYTITFPGPGMYFISEATRAKERNLRLYTQANSGGTTWDFGSAPYLPLPQQWKRRWDGMVAANAKWGLSGVMENHHFGWWPSFIGELEKEAFTSGGMQFDEHLGKIAARDFGAENAEKVVEMWLNWSRDINDLAASDDNQYGPFRIGPAYPFTFGHPAIRSDEFPRKEYASNWPTSICRMDYLSRMYGPQEDVFRNADGKIAGFRQELELLEPMAENYDAGVRQLVRIAAGAPPRRKERIRLAANLAEYLAATVRTAINVKRGAIAYLAQDDAGVIAAAKAEYANAKAALKLVECDSRLGWEPSMEYCGGTDQIGWKLKHMERLYGRQNLE